MKETLWSTLLLDGKGGGAAADWNAIDDWNPSQGLLWIHFDSKINETRAWLENKSGLSQITGNSSPKHRIR